MGRTAGLARARAERAGRSRARAHHRARSRGPQRSGRRGLPRARPRPPLLRPAKPNRRPGPLPEPRAASRRSPVLRLLAGGPATGWARGGERWRVDRWAPAPPFASSPHPAPRTVSRLQLLPLAVTAGELSLETLGPQIKHPVRASGLFRSRCRQVRGFQMRRPTPHCHRIVNYGDQ